MVEIGEFVTIPDTAVGLTKKEVAIAIIADKLGISVEDVHDHTDLGRHAHDITMILTMKGLGDMFIGQFGMKAEDVFSQL